MLRTGGVCGDEGEVDVGGGDAGQVDLRLLSRLFQPLHRHTVVAQVDAVLLLELVGHPVDDTLVEVVAAQVVVACGSQNFLNALAHLNDGHVKGAAAQVVDHDLLVALLIHAVSQSCGSRLVDDPLDVQARNAAGVLGGLTLSIGEVGGDGDDRFGDGFTQIAFCIRFQLLQDHSGDLLGAVALAVHGHLIIGAHVALDGADGPVGVGDRLTLCHLPDHPLAVFGEGHNGRSGASAFVVGDNDGLAAFHNCYTRVSRTKVDANNFSHNQFLLRIQNLLFYDNF